MNKRCRWWFVARYAGWTKEALLLASPVELLAAAGEALSAGAIGVSWQAWEGR